MYLSKISKQIFFKLLDTQKLSIYYYLITLFIVIYVYLLSILILSYYTEGDQVDYTNFYNESKYSEFKDVPILALKHLQSFEPLSYYILWVGAKFNVSKIIWISFLNCILGILVFRYLVINNVYFIAIFLIFTNFYLLGLFSCAERLKISYIFILIALCFNSFIRLFFFILSPFAHLQSFILLQSAIILSRKSFFKSLLRLKIKKFELITLIIFVLIFISFLSYYNEGLYLKFNSYLLKYDQSLFNTFNIFILITLSFLIGIDKFTTIISLTPLIIFAYLFTGNRINMIAITIFLFLVVESRKTKNPYFLLFLLYMSLKSINFIYNIFIHNNGFYKG